MNTKADLHNSCIAEKTLSKHCEVVCELWWPASCTGGGRKLAADVGSCNEINNKPMMEDCSAPDRAQMYKRSALRLYNVQCCILIATYRSQVLIHDER